VLVLACHPQLTAPPLEKKCAAELVVLLNVLSDCSQSDCKRESGSESGDTGAHPTATPDFFRATPAGECLVVSNVPLCGAKLNSLA
jgi:hypothetical protein